MDAYKTPKSELIDERNRPYKPIKGILVGLCYTIVVMTIISVIWMLVIGLILGFDVTSPNLEAEVSKNIIYMISDTIISGIVLFFGGRAIGKRTPGKEIKFGIILTVITIVVYLLITIATESYKAFPILYVLSTFVITAIAIPYGAKTSAKS